MPETTDRAAGGMRGGSAPKASVSPWWAACATAGGLIAAGACLLPFDIAISKWIVFDKNLEMIHRSLEQAEPFGDAAGVVLICAAVYLLDPLRRRELLRLAAASWCAGLSAVLVKSLVGRYRPYHIDFDVVTQTAETFTGWLPMWTNRSNQQSFPSAHTASAVALALMLAAMYPRARGLFLVMAVLCGCQRIETGAHFPSDVLCGAALGLLVVTPFLRDTALSRWFDRYEVAPETAPPADEAPVPAAAA